MDTTENVFTGLYFKSKKKIVVMVINFIENNISFRQLDDSVKSIKIDVILYKAEHCFFVLLTTQFSSMANCPNWYDVA